jgi:hypothetical protein
MSSIIRNGDTFHGISVFGRGVFTNEAEDGMITTYAGQHKDGHACGLGVATGSNGSKVYAEHGPDKKWDGRFLGRYADGDNGYRLYERGEPKDSAFVRADGRCDYNYVACAPDDPRFLALIAQVAPVEVRPQPEPPPPATRRPLTTEQSSDGSAGSFCIRRRSPPPWPPRCTPHAARRRYRPRDTTQRQPHCTARHAVTRARADLP